MTQEELSLEEYRFSRVIATSGEGTYGLCGNLSAAL